MSSDSLYTIKKSNRKQIFTKGEMVSYAKAMLRKEHEQNINRGYCLSRLDNTMYCWTYLQAKGLAVKIHNFRFFISK